MSRLDDELKIAFKRKQPSADFAARVLERINEAPAPKKSWWEALARFFEPPKLRWVAIGVAASLLVVVTAGGYRMLGQKSVEETAPLAVTVPAPETGGADAEKAQVTAAPAVAGDPSIKTVIKKRDAAPRRIKNEARLAGLRKEPAVSKEAEAAKEQVMFALQIAGSTLNDAQKVIQEDGEKSKPEPLHNR